MSNNLPSIIESLLFVSSKPLSVKDFSKLLDQPAEVIQPALQTLIAGKQNSGVVILDNNGEYQMATNAENSTVVKNFLNAELREKLTDASVEVLGIIAYRQPISKAEIEAIRGVNSQYSIRHLLMRGLIEKTPSLNDARSFVYQTTTEFLSHMGLNSTADLPEFEKLVAQIKLPESQIFNPENPLPDLNPSDTPPTQPPVSDQPLVDQTAHEPTSDDNEDDEEEDEDDEDEDDEEK